MYHVRFLMTWTSMKEVSTQNRTRTHDHHHFWLLFSDRYWVSSILPRLWMGIHFLDLLILLEDLGSPISSKIGRTNKMIRSLCCLIFWRYETIVPFFVYPFLMIMHWVDLISCSKNLCSYYENENKLYSSSSSSVNARNMDQK